MERRFNDLARGLATGLPRRRLLAHLLGGIAGTLATRGAAGPAGAQDTCRVTEEFCFGACVTTFNDPSNCGGCGVVCPGGECVAGQCGCPAAQELCSGRCVTTFNDPRNCGGCGNVCPGGTCVAGMCAQSPAPPAPPPPGPSYTSPQFGFQVSWESPWILAEPPTSAPGQYDDLRLLAGDNFWRYTAFFTQLDVPAFLQQAVDARRKDHPDLVVQQGYQGPHSRLSMILAYAAAGVPTTEYLQVDPLKPGERLLLIADGGPTSTPIEVRRQLGRAVHYLGVKGPTPT